MLSVLLSVVLHGSKTRGGVGQEPKNRLTASESFEQGPGCRRVVEPGQQHSLYDIEEASDTL